jgi:hypothetical protein
VWEEKDDRQIQITVRRPHQVPKQGELLGYILFKAGDGSLELANFKAQLYPEHLSLGVSTKRQNNTAAGYHGEGFKLAALVLRRCDYRITISASSCHWNFHFRGKVHPTLSAVQTPISGERIRSLQESSAAKLLQGSRGLEANAWEDVSVKIWKGKDGKGVEIDEFLSWVSAVLDLEGPPSTDIVSTDKGQLILDKAFSGRLYLKGLLLSDTSTRRKPFNFGYNFLEGRVDRDRKQLRDAADEADTLAGIWEHAIQNRRADVLEHVIGMFQNCPSCRDIGEAQHSFTYSTAKTIWTHLISNRENSFYYNEKLGDKVRFYFESSN